MIDPFTKGIFVKEIQRPLQNEQLILEEIFLDETNENN
jgi:hypothetical protein